MVRIAIQEKHERIKTLKSLREQESKFCEQLCLPAHNLGEVNVPTKEQLKELEANVQYLLKEQVRSSYLFSYSVYGSNLRELVFFFVFFFLMDLTVQFWENGYTTNCIAVALVAQINGFMKHAQRPLKETIISMQRSTVR